MLIKRNLGSYSISCITRSDDGWNYVEESMTIYNLDMMERILFLNNVVLKIGDAAEIDNNLFNLIKKHFQ